MSLSTAEISAQLDRVLSSDPKAVAIAIRASSRQPWPETMQQHGREFRLRWCESSLALREALCDLDRDLSDSNGLVVITPLATHEVAEDIAARLARARIFQPEGWDIVRQLFQAKETDSRLGRFSWMPQALIDAAAQSPYSPAANGFLDLETAWREVLQRFLGINAARPDPVALLHWSISADANLKLARLPAHAREDVLRWLNEAGGPVGALLLGCVEAGRTPDALPLGLVCGVIFAPGGEGQASLGQAAIRLERFVNDQHVGVQEGRGWAQAAEQVIRLIGFDGARAVQDRADALLRELRISDFAHLSTVLPSSLDQRLDDFALALGRYVTEPNEPNLQQVELQADRALQHVLMATQQTRMERVEMARRLARWLMLPAPSASSIIDAVNWQADQGAFVDWARFRLLGGDELPELSQAYAACRQAVITRRNAFAKAFAQTLAHWNAQVPTADKRVVPLEYALERIVAPVAATHPVLVLVMDGLSISIFRELFARISAQGWSEMVPAELGKPLVGVAALPTITEVSRATLLCGRLTTGTSAQEKAGFASHAALLSHSKAGAPPRLFHKGDLADATNLASEVRAAIAGAQHRVVGVVYNAVDDHLSGPDQLHQRWMLDDLRLLLPLLREAREARRVVVVTADHGHLLDDGTTQLPGADSDRWRPGTNASTPHEIAIAGARVLTPDGSGNAVCLWGENTRYSMRRNGYHGGLSPQEAAVPLSVFVPVGLNVPGWELAAPAQPEWWELPPVSRITQVTPAAENLPKPNRRKTTSPEGQQGLFEHDNLPPPQAQTDDDWISFLFDSPIYRSQKQLAARVAPPDDTLRSVLEALSERGGKLSRAALAHRLSVPEVRISGLLSAVRRLLNVDQATVLSVDDNAGTIDLNIALLRQQFRLTGQGISR